MKETGRMWWRRVVSVGVAVAFVAAASITISLVHHEAVPKGVDIRFEVPAGTGATLDAGGTVAILPRDLEVHVGDRLIVDNRDDRTHEVGPWTVPAKATFQIRFTQVGRYDSHCALHAGGGRFFIDVLAPTGDRPA
jgi:plastocyanin